MAVELFKKVFDKFNGTTLPATVGLKNLLTTEYQVVPDRVVPTVRIMLDSAEQAGLFSAAGNRTRMVMPLAAAPPHSAARPAAPAKHLEVPPHGSSGGGGGGDGIDIDPAILGLLKRLPPGGTPLSGKKRKALIEAFTATVNFIYPDADGDGE